MSRMSDADYVDDLVLPTNTPAQAVPLLQSLDLAAWDICLNVND